MAGLDDYTQDQLDQALDNFDDIQFDVFIFCQVL